MRVDLDGQPVAPVSPEDQAAAQQRYRRGPAPARAVPTAARRRRRRRQRPRRVRRLAILPRICRKEGNPWRSLLC